MRSFIQTQNMIIRADTINRLEALSPKGTRIQLVGGTHIDTFDDFKELTTQILEGDRYGYK